MPAKPQHFEEQYYTAMVLSNFKFDGPAFSQQFLRPFVHFMDKETLNFQKKYNHLSTNKMDYKKGKFWIKREKMVLVENVFINPC